MQGFVDIILACILIALAAGCSSRPANFYTLRGAAASAATTSSNFSVAVGPVSIPAMLDRPQLVLTTGPNQVAIDEFNRWAAPLQNIISRAVAENLTVMLGTSLVTLFPDATSMEAVYRAVIDVQRFESALGDAATLDAVWLIRRMKDGVSQTGRTTAREPASGKDYAVLVAAQNRAVERLSQDIANAVRALARGEK
ncbi:MAG TPA: PqiC family protein [Candidatus Binatia bacterium]